MTDPIDMEFKKLQDRIEELAELEAENDELHAGLAITTLNRGKALARIEDLELEVHLRDGRISALLEEVTKHRDRITALEASNNNKEILLEIRADRIEELEAGLEHIAAQGYTGASWVARQILTGELNKILNLEALDE